MTDAPQEYLHRKKKLKDLPDHNRMTEEEKLKFESTFRVFRNVKREFAKSYLKRAVSEIVQAHENDTDSNDEVEVLKHIRILVFLKFKH